MTESIPQKLNCLIIDDEEPAHEVLRFLIGKVHWLQHCGSCYNAVDALELIPRLRPDIIFLDVNMPELSGLDLLRILENISSQVIMTTAYQEYAIEGFNFDVASFLLKPIAFDRFLKATTKVRRLYSASHPETAAPSVLTPETFSNNDITDSTVHLPETQLMDSSAQDDFIWVRADRKMYCVWLKDIYFIEGLKDYVKVYYKNGMLVSLMSMATISNRLPSSAFVRTHRSYIVNKNCIRVIEGNIITMANGMQVTIAASSNRDKIFRQLTEKR